jgi:hypothetical protein
LLSLFVWTGVRCPVPLKPILIYIILLDKIYR